MPVRAPKTRPWLVHALVLREVIAPEDGARPDGPPRLVPIHRRTDHMRAGTARTASSLWSENLPIMSTPQLDAVPLGLDPSGDLVLLATCGSVRTAWRWRAGHPLQLLPEEEAERLDAAVHADEALLAARARLARLLADHGRRDPRLVGRGARALLVRQAARDCAGSGEDADALAERLLAEQVGDAPAPRARGAAVMGRLLGDL